MSATLQYTMLGAGALFVVLVLVSERPMPIVGDLLGEYVPTRSKPVSPEFSGSFYAMLDLRHRSRSDGDSAVTCQRLAPSFGDDFRLVVIDAAEVEIRAIPEARADHQTNDESSDFTLAVLGLDEVVIAFDDDTEGEDPVLQMRLEPGEYHIRVGSRVFRRDRGFLAVAVSP